MFRFALSTHKFMQLHRCVLISLLLALPAGLAGAQNYLSPSKSNGLYPLDLSPPKSSCCGAETGTMRLTGGIPQYETYKLTATYYSLRDNLTTTLMLNNKGSEPILAWPTFYSLGGTRLQLEPITVGAASYLDIELSQLLAQAGEEFREGSVNIAYQGGNQQLGAQIKMVDAERNLIWAEQFVYGSKFVSSRLETVWWLPFDETKTRVVVSNTSGDRVTATITVEGTAPEQSAPANMVLAPWETRVLDIMTDLVGHPHGLVKFKGGISIVHTGSPGAVLARMFIAEPKRGYSAAAIFIDPETAASQRWHGNGLRFKNLDRTGLEPVLAVRNIGDQFSRVHGRIIYTLPDGSTSAINILPQLITPGATRVFNLGKVIKNANLPNAVAYGGIELEYDTPKGTILTSVQSLNPTGNHVFEVPMFDPQDMPSSAGGFPWKADGDYTTIVYIKNETPVARKFVSHLVYGSGQYSLGIRDLKPGETVAIDFRELRDNQSPDSQGNLIPLNVDNGQIAWSVLGAENKVLSGRSEQVSLSGGVASTYACANCCPNVIYEVFVDPFSLTTSVGLTNQFTTTQTEQNCYGTLFGPYQGYADQWNSFNPGIATIDFTGSSEAVGVGDTNIEGCVERTIWYNWGGGYCEPFTDLICNQAPVEVQPKIDNITPGLGPIDSSVGISIVGSGFGSSPTVNVAGGGITASVQSSSETSISVTLSISADAGGGDHGITVTANGKQSNPMNFFVQIPTKLRRNSMSALQDEGGCGAVRNLSYTLLDQNGGGDPIDTNGTISEGVSDFNGPPGVQPPPETQRTMSHGTFPDTVGYNIATCPPPFTATFVQSFTVHLNTPGRAWVLSSQNSVSMGRTSAGAKFVNITFTQ